MAPDVLIPLPQSDDALIPAERLPSYVPLARQTLARWRCEGSGPAFVKIGRKVAYRAGTIRQWLAGLERKNTY
jgi:hypothetical protein